ncbi:ABC transporter substrate-binding protein [Microbacterium panaciterrae]|uniref:ABC transporter substrate-binding protein n=1 Tax=Microbacterium panaciterrae TaxID=985759 RepID=A0ABP8PKX3_9MICO
MKLRKKIALAAVALVTAGLLSSCSPGGSAQQASSVSSFPKKWDKEITIDVFDGLANYMGMQDGWFGDMVKKKFNLKLNIIAPNVAGGGDTLYNTRVSAGNLGDLIITDKGQKLDELVKGGLVLDSTPYSQAMSHVNAFKTALTELNQGKKGIYAFPTSVSSLKPTQPSEGIDPTFGPFVRWDLYAKLGYPKLNTLEDLLPVLKKMQEAEPTAPNGKKTYAISLFKDWDGNMMVTAKQPTTFYGYDEMGFTLAKADGSDYQSLLDDKGQYFRALKFYQEANAMGLVDPESTTQNFDTMQAKVKNGQVLFSWWPWLGQAAYNTDANTQAGKGFELAPVKDLKVFSYGAPAYGGTQVLAIGSKAKDPERIAAFIDWLYSAEGAYSNNSQTMGAAGPQGLTWDKNSSGKPELTDFGKKAFLSGDADVPAEWGGGTYVKGASALNVTTVLPVDIDPATGYSYSYKGWPSYQDLTKTPLSEDWSAHMGGAVTTMDYLTSNKKLMVAPGASFTTPTDASEIQTLRNQLKAIIIQYSWQMSFAKDDAEFASLKKELQDKANGLGYDKVLKVDLANAKEQNAQRVKVAKELG